jgi:hypothetical protein
MRRKKSARAIDRNGCEQRDKHFVSIMIPIKLTMPEQVRAPQGESGAMPASR